MVTARVSRSAHDQPFSEHYPLQLEYELRRYLIAGEERRALACAEEFLRRLEIVYGDSRAALKSGIMQAIIVLYHKALQVGIPVEESISRIILVARRLENIETRDGLSTLLKDVVAQIAEKTNQQTAEEEFCQKVKSYIQAHFHKDITLGTLAEAMHLEPTHLSRTFAKKMGLDFRDYLAQTRIQEAKKLLVKTGLSVSEVGVMVGYRDVAYFIRVFKRLVGVTPGQFAQGRSVEQSDKEARHNPLRSRFHVMSSANHNWQANDADAYPWLLEKNLSTALLSGDPLETGRATEHFLSALMENVREIQALKSYVVKLVVVLARKCAQNGVRVEAFLAETIEKCLVVDRLETYEEVRGFLYESTEELCRRVVLQKNETIRAVEILKDYMRANYRQPVKLGELAALVNYSPCYLVRVFSRLTGFTPHEFLTNLRIGMARELLLKRELTVDEIAVLVGYQDASHFISTFKKRFGQTPKEYAERSLLVSVR